MIYLDEVLAKMRQLDLKKNPVPFDIKVREFNRQNKSAGRMKEYFGATLMQKGRFKKVLKEPHHWENRTRNIKLADGSIKKIHTIFISEFNNLKVVF